jgi:hypothetical protein
VKFVSARGDGENTRACFAMEKSYFRKYEETRVDVGLRINSRNMISCFDVNTREVERPDGYSWRKY